MNYFHSLKFFFYHGQKDASHLDQVPIIVRLVYLELSLAKSFKNIFFFKGLDSTTFLNAMTSFFYILQL